MVFLIRELVHVMLVCYQSVCNVSVSWLNCKLWVRKITRNSSSIHRLSRRDVTNDGHSVNRSVTVVLCILYDHSLPSSSYKNLVINPRPYSEGVTGVEPPSQFKVIQDLIKL